MAERGVMEAVLAENQLLRQALVAMQMAADRLIMHMREGEQRIKTLEEKSDPLAGFEYRPPLVRPLSHLREPSGAQIGAVVTPGMWTKVLESNTCDNTGLKQALKHLRNISLKGPAGVDLAVQVLEHAKSGESDVSSGEEPNAKRCKRDPNAQTPAKSVMVLLDSDVFVSDNNRNVVLMPDTIEMAQLKKPEKGRFGKIPFTSAMTQRDVLTALHLQFPILRTKRRLCCASAANNQTRLDFHGDKRIWNGPLINRHIRGDSVLYVFAEENHESEESQVLFEDIVHEVSPWKGSTKGGDKFHNILLHGVASCEIDCVSCFQNCGRVDLELLNPFTLTGFTPEPTVKRKSESPGCTCVKLPKRTHAVKEGSTENDDLERLANKIIGNEWKKLGRRLLNSDEALLYAIDKDNDTCCERAYQMLLKWKAAKGSDATYRVLHDALCHDIVNRRDLAEEFCLLTDD